MKNKRKGIASSTHLRPVSLVFVVGSILIFNVIGTCATSFLAQGASVQKAAIPAFAAGGFGGSSKSSGSKKKKNTKKKKKGGAGATAAKRPNNLFTPEGRMAHIRSRLGAADVSPMANLSLMQNKDGQLALDIDPNAICVVDNFLGKDLISAMRQEAESLLPTLVPSQSTRFDEKSQTVVPYEKVGVLSTQIEGGATGYEASPRLVEYIVTLTSGLSQKLNQILPESHHLSGSEQTNKLAVCLGDGSMYDKHIDNLGGGEKGAGDQRKLTALLYLQPPGSHDGQPEFPNESVEDDPRGGYFRAYDVPESDQVTCIAPRGDRLIMFWSDSLVHDVSPSFCPAGDTDRRWALTVWFVVGEDGVIRTTDAEIEKKHFGTG
mmetsp:Transcript_29956/g.45946  ORF Transcript_29956/g.45946 Transcript_29956/m.45946 type:complete len:377 (-) Transcript_29956:1475-2605(-)